MSANIQPGDQVLYCPTGDWTRGHFLEAVLITILGPEAGHREGNLKITLTSEEWRLSTYRTRIVRPDKVRRVLEPI